MPSMFRWPYLPPKSERIVFPLRAVSVCAFGHRAYNAIAYVYVICVLLTKWIRFSDLTNWLSSNILCTIHIYTYRMESATALGRRRKKSSEQNQSVANWSAAFICARVMVRARAATAARIQRALMGIYAPGSGVRTHTPHTKCNVN